MAAAKEILGEAEAEEEIQTNTRTQFGSGVERELEEKSRVLEEARLAEVE